MTDRARQLEAVPAPDFALVPFPGIKPTQRTRIGREREQAYNKALAALSGYKFWMFGYHAAQWVLLNRLVDKPDRQRNPFRPLVDVARRMERVETEEGLTS